MNLSSPVSAPSGFVGEPPLSPGAAPRPMSTTEKPPSAPPPSGGGPSLEAQVVRLGLMTPDEVDRWAAFLESRGITLDARPRTHRDGARSCYLRDPDGNQVQIIYHPPISGKF